VHRNNLFFEQPTDKGWIREGNKKFLKIKMEAQHIKTWEIQKKQN
jgi:hypothetical protein